MGFLRVNARDYAAALAGLSQIRHVDGEHAAPLVNALASACMRTGKPNEARKQPETALKWDRTDADKRQTEGILRYLDAAAERDKRLAIQTAHSLVGERPALARQEEQETSATAAGVAGSTPMPLDFPASASNPVARAVEGAGFASFSRFKPPAASRRRCYRAEQNGLIKRHWAPASGTAPARTSNPVARQAEKLDRVKGTAKSVDSAGKRLLVGHRRQDTFDISQPDKVSLKHNGSCEFAFNCGPQKPFHVKVEFAPPEKGRNDVRGTLRSLEFRFWAHMPSRKSFI